MRTRSSRTYAANSNTWQGVALNFRNLMSQAPASTTSHHNPRSQMSSDSETTASPSPPPRPPRRRTSLQRTTSARSDLVVRNVAVLGLLLALSLLFVNLALYLAIFVVGVLTPAWQTFKALEARDRPVIIELDDQQPCDHSCVAEPPQIRNWQAYWIIAAILLSLNSLVMSPLLARFIPGPLYYSMLFTLVTWLTRNSAGNAVAIYDCYLKPAFQKSETTIDAAADSVLTHIDHISQQALLAVNEAVSPYAKHLEHAAAVATRQMQEQARVHARASGGRGRRHQR